NRLQVALTASLLIALTGGVIATIWQSVRAERQRALAQQRAAETRRLANSLMTEFDDEINNIAGGYPTPIKFLKASSEYLERLAQQTDDPTVMKEVAAAHLHLASAYESGISDQGQAETHRRLVIDISRQVLANGRGDLTAKELLAEGLMTQSTGDLET